MKPRPGAVLLLFLSFASAVAVTVGYAANRSGPVVTLIGDSVADAVEHDPDAIDRLNTGFTLNLQTRGCRRLATQSCMIAGATSPAANVVNLTKQLGPRLGKIVVIAVGYNDDPGRFDRDFDNVMRTLTAQGVRRVVWLTLREARSLYSVSNRNIRIEPREWPTLTVADWNAYSADHPQWFEADGLHLTPAGADAFAAFVSRTLRRVA